MRKAVTTVRKGHHKYDASNTVRVTAPSLNNWPEECSRVVALRPCAAGPFPLVVLYVVLVECLR